MAVERPGPGRKAEPAGGVHELRPGRMLGQFRIVGPLGRGGMGVVYEAEDTLLKRKVAIKTLPAPGDPATAALLREAQAAARLDHPNVIRVHHIGQWDAGYFLVLELARGGSLQARVGPGRPLPWPDATRAAADACRGLAAAHAAGFVHRDVKPANLMLDESGSVKVADFGLVRGGELTATASAHLVGTPHFMSPEQCRGEAADARSDVYALGGTYFALLTGRPPFVAPTPVQVMFAHCTLPAPDPRKHVATLPPGCAAVVGKAMAKEPTDRYRTADEMLAALLALLAPQPLPDDDTDAFELPTPPRTSISHPRRPAPARPAKRRRLAAVRTRVWAVAGLVLFAAVVAVVVVAAWPSREPVLAPAARPAGEKPVPQNAPPAVNSFNPVIPKEGRSLSLGGSVSSVAFSADGAWIAAGVSTGTEGVTVWDRRTGAARQVAWGPVNALVFRTWTPGGSTSLIGGGGRGPRGYSIEQGTDMPFLMGDNTTSWDALSAAAEKEGRAVAFGYATGELKGAVRQYDYRNGSSLPNCDRGQWAVRQIAYAPGAGNDELAVVYADGAILMYDSRTGRQLPPPNGTIPGGTEKLTPVVAFDPSGALLAVALGDRVRFWNHKNHKDDRDAVVFLAPGPNGATPVVTALAYAPNGKHLVVGEASGRATIWNVETGAKKIHNMNWHIGTIRSVAFSPDGQTVVTGSADKTVRLWNVSAVLEGSS